MNCRNKSLAVLVCALVLIVGCGINFKTARVDQGVLEEVRALGAVLGEASTELLTKDGSQVATKFVIKMERYAGSSAIRKVCDLLHANGWVTQAQNSLLVSMRSPRWKNVILTVTPFRSDLLKGEAELLQQVDASIVNSNDLVIVRLDALQ